MSSGMTFIITLIIYIFTKFRLNNISRRHIAPTHKQEYLFVQLVLENSYKETNNIYYSLPVLTFYYFS